MSDLLSHFDTQIQNQEQLLREREQELEQLRRLRDRLADLTRQREELHAQLRALENEISLTERTMSSSLHRFGTRFEAVAPPAAAPAVPPAASSAARTTEPPVPAVAAKPTTLKDEIKKVLRAARGPLTGPEIAEKIRAAGYKTSSANFANIVKKHLGEMDEVTHSSGQGYKLKK